MIKKVVLYQPNHNPISFSNPVHMEINDGILTLDTKDDYRYITNLPFMAEFKKEKENE